MLLLIGFLQQTTMAQIPKVAAGTIKRFENMPSAFVAARTIDVWLPDGYNANKKYAVLYMHDGNALFDAATMWNHQEWGVDEIISKLITTNRIKDCIVVGIWNGGASRHSEYFPQKPFESLTESQQTYLYTAKRNNAQIYFSQKVQSDNYLRFLVTELKPFIDKNFATLPDKDNTFVAGSSMGGLISMYAICEYPQVFGGAACMSTHWVGISETVNNPVPAAFMQYLQQHLPAPQQHKIYFDYGSETLDSLYKPFQLQADVIMQQKGYNSSNWLSKEFVGADHSENAWNKRFEIPVSFLLGK
jgi:predicted alpha/beta superfamily hydrolase